MRITKPIHSSSVVEATEYALHNADHLTPADAGAVQALRALALKIDAQDDYFRALTEHAHEVGGRPPSVDNVSLPTYLKFSESLGLTPSGRGKTGRGTAAPAPEPAPARTRLASLQDLRPDAARGA